MPTSRAHLRRRCLPPAARSMPSTTMRPFCTVSSRLMQRISVDLPEPEGPQMTMRSPARTARSMSVSTWKSPNHLFSAFDDDDRLGAARRSRPAVLASARLHRRQLRCRATSGRACRARRWPGSCAMKSLTALSSSVLPRPHRHAHDLLLQHELLLVGVRRRALVDLRRDRGRAAERIDLARHQRLHARGVVVEAADLGAGGRDGGQRDVLGAGAGDADASGPSGRPAP